MIKEMNPNRFIAEAICRLSLRTSPLTGNNLKHPLPLPTPPQQINDSPALCTI